MSNPEFFHRIHQRETGIVPFQEWESLFGRTIFARHGKTALNERGVLQGSSDQPLSENGKKEVQLLGGKILNSSRDVSIIFSSPMLRARETSSIMAANLSVTKNLLIEIPSLGEYNFGQLESAPIIDLQQDTKHNEWLKHPISLDGIFPEDAESFIDFLQRVNTGVRSISNHNSQNAMVISHAMVTRAIRFLALLSSRGVTTFDQANLSEHESEFFYSNPKTEENKFIKIPHSVFEISPDSLEFASI